MIASKVTPGAKPGHPYDQWFTEWAAGKILILVKGRDYHGPTATMAQQLRNRAVERKVRLTIRMNLEADCLVVRLSRKPRQHYGKRRKRATR